MIKILIGYILGIYMGVYLNVQPHFFIPSIGIFLLFLLILLIIRKTYNKGSLKRKDILFKALYKKYYFLILILILFSSLAIVRINIIDKYREELLLLSEKRVNQSYTIKIIKKEKQYNLYNAKVLFIDELKIKNINIVFKSNIDFKLTKTYKVVGIIEKLSEEKNFKGFNERRYYNSKRIDFKFKIIKDSKFYELDTKNELFDYIILLRNEIISNIDSYFEDSVILKGILLGDTKDLDEDVKNKFKDINIYHILAVSGLHISYLVLILNIIFNKLRLRINRKIKIFIQILILFIFMIIVDLTSSVSRAVFLFIITIIFKEFNIRYGFLNSIILSIFLQLLINPYIVYSSSFYLSYTAAISIYYSLKIEKNLKLFSKIINKLKIDEYTEWILRDRVIRKERFKILKKDSKLKGDIKKDKIKYPILKKILSFVFYNIYISVIVYISLLPLLIYYYNQITLNFFIAQLLISLILPFICILGFIFIFFTSFIYVFSFIPLLKLNFINTLLNIISLVTNTLVKVLVYFIDFTYTINSKLKVIYYIRPFNIVFVILYYLILFGIFYTFSKDIGEFYSFKTYLKKKKGKFIKRKYSMKIITIFLILLLVFSNIFIFDILSFRKVNLSFIYVGQGDSSFITTDKGSVILIDTGSGGENSYIDYGKEVRRYVLANGKKKIDHLFISHFDTDHIGGVFTLIDSFKINKIYIPKHYIPYIESRLKDKYKKTGIKLVEELKMKDIIKREGIEQDYLNYFELIKRAKENKVDIIELERGDILNIDKSTKVDILFPTKEMININMSNNNCLVFKVNMKINNKNTSILYTGDIEKEAIIRMLELESLGKIDLKSDIIKIPHHGSKTSLNSDFLNKVNAKIAIISCGENNIYKHPHFEVIRVLEDLKYKVYRTDIEGEVNLKKLILSNSIFRIK